MTLNRQNYEVFLVDYLDGKLTPSLVAELMTFLDHNPDIKDELDGLEDAVLVNETIAYPDKSTLKKKSFLKNGIDNEFEYLCIASVEGIITHDEKFALERIVQENADKQNHLLTFQKAKVTPNTAIAYPAKSRLKRTSLIPIRYSTLKLSISVAATITLLIGIYTIDKFMVNSNQINNHSTSTIAESTIPTVNKIDNEVQNSVVSTIEKTATISPEKTITVKSVLANKEVKSTRLNIEESIPNFIHRIDLKNEPIQDSPQQEQLAKLAAQYASANQIPIDQLYAQQESGTRKELGIFEVIQFGVKSFGKLVGKDINLKAEKDRKGNIEKLCFESNLVAFSTPVRKNE